MELATEKTGCKKIGRGKKAAYYTLDAILAGIMLATIAILLLKNPFYEPQISQKSYISEDLLTVLSELKIYELNNTFIQNEINTSSITNTNNTILEQIGEYWALNKTTEAETLFDEVLSEVLPSDVGIRLRIESDEIYLKNKTSQDVLLAHRRMVAGIAKDAPLKGFSASAYLKKIKDKKSSAYIYYGGFVGQGNISGTLLLPEDFTPSRLVESELTIETPGDFELYINNQKCGSTYYGNPHEVQTWNITSCYNSFSNEDNNITLIFTSSLNESYVSGGFLKTTYTTDELRENSSIGIKRYYFPTIDGFINIYDAISAQGTINNYTVNITFYNEYETFLTIGNETIFIANPSNATQNVEISKLGLSLDPKEIPLRLGTTNISNITILDAGQPADSFLVTDVSGSMGTCALYENITEEYCRYEYYQWWTWYWTQCPYTGTCNDNECGVWAWGGSTRNHQVINQTTEVCSATMMELAKEADMLFVETILNDSTLHKIGLVDFSTNANPATSLTNSETVLDTEIATYTASGGTCTCCGINRARNLISSSTNKKFIIVLSDGEPTYYCSSLNDYTGDGSGGSSDLVDRQAAIDAAQEACDNNITVFSIGFGESMSTQGHDVMKQIACNESLYFNATNTSQLLQIYENISDQVLLSANFTSQTINIAGNFTPSRIFPNSYIDIYYTPLITDTLGKLSLTVESDQLGTCESIISIPANIQIEDAVITSFSSNHWTKELDVNGVNVFNLSEYGSEYNILGDPFTVQIPSALLIPGADNNISLIIGDDPTNTTNCSSNNTIIYTALINSSTPRTQTLEVLEGCEWTVESESGIIETIDIPAGYSGSNTCFYTNASVSYNPLDAYDSAAHHLFTQMDPDNNQKVLVTIGGSDLEITLTVVSDIPYMWGPSTIRTEVWT